MLHLYSQPLVDDDFATAAARPFCTGDITFSSMLRRRRPLAHTGVESSLRPAWLPPQASAAHHGRWPLLLSLRWCSFMPDYSLWYMLHAGKVPMVEHLLTACRIPQTEGQEYHLSG